VCHIHVQNRHQNYIFQLSWVSIFHNLYGIAEMITIYKWWIHWRIRLWKKRDKYVTGKGQTRASWIHGKFL
jgi:hypothetical protein